MASRSMSCVTESSGQGFPDSTILPLTHQNPFQWNPRLLLRGNPIYDRVDYASFHRMVLENFLRATDNCHPGSNLRVARPTDRYKVCA